MDRNKVNFLFLCLICSLLFNIIIPFESNAFIENSIFEFKWSFDAKDSIDSSPLLFDLELDGEYEVLFGSNDKKFYCLDNNGNIKWFFETKGPIQ